MTNLKKGLFKLFPERKFSGSLLLLRSLSVNDLLDLARVVHLAAATTGAGCCNTLVDHTHQTSWQARR